MPDAVPMTQLLVERVDDDATGIEQATCGKPRESRRSQCSDQRLDRDHAEPSHHDIDDHRKDPAAFGQPGFLNDAENGQSPDHPEERPAPGTCLLYTSP